MWNLISKMYIQAGVLLLLLGYTSCNTLYHSSLGVHLNDRSHPYNDEMVIKETTKYFGNTVAIGRLDTSIIVSLYFMTDTGFAYTTPKRFMRLLLQPLNVVWFNPQKTLYALVANCDADNKGLVRANLSWKYYHNTFPVDSNLNFKAPFSNDDFEKFVHIIRPGNQTVHSPEAYVYVLWGQLMGRQYHNFLREWSVYFKNHPEVQLVVVNTDHIWAMSKPARR